MWRNDPGFLCWSCGSKFNNSRESCPSCKGEMILNLIKLTCVDCGNVFMGMGGDYCYCPECDGETMESDVIA